MAQSKQDSGGDNSHKRRDPRVVSKSMRQVKGRDTSPEVAFRKELWARGFRYRLCDSKLPGKPDIVMPGKRLAVFVDGDFWHGNQWQQRGFASLEEQFAESDSKDYWVPKIRGNMRRDRANTAKLIDEGWRVVRVWASSLKEHMHACVDMTVRAAEVAPPYHASPQIPKSTFAEFFAGIGLVRLALERHDWKGVFANDVDPQKYDMYAENFRNDSAGHYRLEDIHKLSGDDVPSVTLATASFPCTDLSLAGARNGLAGAQSGTLFALLRILDEMGERRPPIVMLENVTGFLTSHKGEDFHRGLLELNNIGYAVDVFQLDAVAFVPQSRPRLFVIGVKDEGDDTAMGPNILFPESTVRPQKLRARMLSLSDVHWRILRLPVPRVRRRDLSDLLEDLPDDAPEWWSQERVEYLLNQMSEKHRQEAERMMRSISYQYGTVFRRMRRGRSTAELRTDRIAGCLRTPRGGSSRQILVKAGKSECLARLLTPREYARLQGVPDSYRISVPRNQAFFGFGDAVCVPAIEWIVKNYLNVVVNQLLRGRVFAAADGYAASQEGA